MDEFSSKLDELLSNVQTQQIPQHFLTEYQKTRKQNCENTLNSIDIMKKELFNELEETNAEIDYFINENAKAKSELKEMEEEIEGLKDDVVKQTRLNESIMEMKRALKEYQPLKTLN